MEFLIALGVVIAALWGAIALAHLPTIRTGWLVVVGCAVYVTQIFFGYDFFHRDFGPIPLTLDRGLLLLWGAMWVVAVWQRRGIWWRFDTLDAVVLAWIAVLGCNVLMHDWTFRNHLPLSRLLFFYLLPLLQYLVWKNLPLNERQIRGVLVTWAVAGVVLALYGIAEWRGWYSLIYPRYIADSSVIEFFGRARGPLLNPMINGMLMLVGWSAAFILWRTRQKPEGHGWLAVLPVILIGVYATLTRSVWVGALFTVGIWVLTSVNRAWRIRLICAGLIVGGLGLSIGKEALNSFKRDRFVSAAEMSESIRLRPILAAVAWEMFQDHPVDGVGFGLYHKHKAPYHYSDEYGLPLQMGLVYTQHNVFLAYLAETGLVGLGSLLLVLGATFWFSWRVTLGACCPEPTPSDQRLNDLHRALGWLSLTIAGGIVINGMFHDVSIIPLGIAHWLCGLAVMGQFGSQRVWLTGSQVAEFFAERRRVWLASTEATDPPTPAPRSGQGSLPS